MRQIAVICVVALVMGVLAIAQAVPMPDPIPISLAGQEVQSPQAAVDSQDRTLIVWARRDDASRNLRIQFARLDSDGVASVPVDLSADGRQATDPQIAIDSQDRATVTWSITEAGQPRSRIQAIQIDASGSQGVPVDVSDAGLTAFNPQVAIDGQDQATITWNGSGPDNVSRIRAVQLTGAGNPGTPEILSATGVQAFNPQIAIDSQDIVTVTWHVEDGVGSTQVQASRFAAGGTPGLPRNISEGTLEGQAPQIAIDGQDQPTITWQGTSALFPTTLGIYAVRLDAAGDPGVTQPLSDGAGEALRPQIAVDAQGRATITWYQVAGSTTRVHARRINADTTLGADHILSGVDRFAEGPQVAVDRQGRATVTWYRKDAGIGGNPQVEAVRLAADGVPGTVQVLSGAASLGSDPQATTDSQGRATVVWEEGLLGAGLVQAAQFHTALSDAPACLAPTTITSTAVQAETVVPNGGTVAPTIDVVATGVITDVDVLVDISHADSGQIDVVLRSPSGSDVVLSTGNGTGVGGIFEGTTFTDQASGGPVSDAVTIAGKTLLEVQPEGALASLVGEDPNGTWTLEVTDASTAGAATVHGFELVLTTTDVLPVTTQRTVPSAIGVPISETIPTVVALEVTGAYSDVVDVNLVTDISHELPEDLDITLASPAGTTTTITTDNGGAVVASFEGTTWDDNPAAGQPGIPATDAVYVDGVVQTLLQPEGAMAAFVGEDPNGTWILTITDDQATNTGTLNSWSLDIAAACDAPPPPPTPITPPAPPPPADGGGGLGGGGGAPATGEADLAVATSVDPATVETGDTADLSMTVDNNGPDDATGASVSVALPNGVSPGTLPTGCTTTATRVTCTLGDLADGASATRAIPLTPSAAGEVILIATATTEATDPTAGNNTASATLTVSEPVSTGGTAATVDLTGDDVIQTAIDASQARFPTPAQAFAQTAQPTFVVLARADVFADALGGSVLLGDAPLLFTTPDTLDPRTATEIDRLGVDTVYLLGGTAALSADIATTLTTNGAAPVRLAGPTRVETAVAVATEAVSTGIADGTRIALARATGDATAAWADSVTGGGYAATTGTPILLTQTGELHPAVATFIDDNTTTATVLLGGTAALNETIQTSVPTPIRVSGPNRAATAVQIARRLLQVSPNQQTRGYHLVDGTAENGWAFGLIAAGLVADTGQPILLTAAETPPETLTEATGCDNGVTLTPLGTITPASLNQLQGADTPTC